MTMTPPLPPAPPNGNGRHKPRVKRRASTGGLTATVSSDVGAAPRRRPTIGTIFIALAVVAALNLLIYAFSIASQQDDGPAVPTAIESLVPIRNGLLPRQGQVGVDLSDEYTGVLLIERNGEFVEIPEDQLDRRVAQGVVTFQPGPTKEFEIFNPGRHTIKVLYWKQIESRDQAHEYSWQFNVD